MQSNYPEEEEKERQVLLKVMQILRPKNYTLSEVGSFKTWDFLLSYPKNDYLGEIKCRSFDSNKHNCIFLEEKKAKNLIFEGFKMGIYEAPIYLTHYTDDVIHYLRITPALLSLYPPVWKMIQGIRKSIYLIPTGEAKILNI